VRGVNSSPKQRRGGKIPPLLCIRATGSWSVLASCTMIENHSIHSTLASVKSLSRFGLTNPYGMPDIWYRSTR
jgi:hypothetical protein